ncbi:WD repeat-containing protein 73 isoform X2 [Rhineura floridana]|uniref:WD repeat-containing protein 73 isoform X2 n=1 Tax=Rhineura floridana TaxID=261503 RepID=UPI002AC89280|nr:WD repeat-containing protein 73 isoform X2 [Rhineura floridana]
MRRPGRASSSLAAAWNSGEMEEEDWLLESLRLYNDLHVFELQDPTRVIEWTGEKSICVAGYESRRNEILQLLLPQKLYAKENQGLCPERDFKVEHGGFSDRPVYSLKHVPETSLLVTSGPPDSALQVWRMEENESASTNTNELATLEFLDEAAILACSTKGQLFLADTRQPQSLLAVAEDAAISGALAGQSLCAGVRRSPMGSATDRPLVARLSSGGHVVLTDLRNPASPVKAAQCRVPTASPCGAEFPTVSFAPLLGERLAVSGFDGTVQVYDMRSWGPSAQEASPEFVHKGHVFSGVGDAGGPPLVTTHTWNPSKPRTLLSAASDGSLHVWDWSELLGAS